MKKFLWISFSIVLLAVLALFIFILSFDADRYRPELVRQLEKQLGRPIEIGHLSLAFRQGLALSVKDVRIPPSLTWEEINVNLRPESLLAKQIEVTSVFLKNGTFSSEKFQVSQIDVFSNDFLFAGPFTFELRAALTGDKQNIFLSGEADMQTLSLKISDGYLSTGRFEFEKLRADLLFKKDQIEIHDFLGAFADGQIQISGDIFQPMGQAQTTFKAVFQDLSIGVLTSQKTNSGSPALQGRLTTALSGSFQGLRWDQISRSLNGKGRIQINDAVILNYNAFAAILKKLSKIPGVGDAILNAVPPAFGATLRQSNTPLKPIDFFVNIHDSKMDFDRLLVETDAFQIGAAGEIRLDSHVSARATLWMHPQLSASLTQSIPPIQMVTGQYGLIEIPLIIGGNIPHLSVKPDMDYLTSKIVSSKVGELASNLLGNQGKGAGNVLGALLGQPSQGQSQGSGGIDSILGKLLKKQE